MKQKMTILIATRKGGFLLRDDGSRRKWNLSNPLYLGNVVHHMVQDPRDRRTILMAARTGHLGPTIFRSRDGGKSWKEASRPPAFPKAESGQKALVVHHTFWLTPGHASQSGVWYAGTSPQGLFRSEDQGDTWEGVAGFNQNPMRSAWTADDAEIPDGGALHSILIDPRNPQHMYIGMSLGGFFESTDAGNTWKPLNKGCLADFIPGPEPEFGQDPHCVKLHPMNPDRLYMQNHCGIYRMDRSDEKWIRIGNNMPKRVGDIGFPMVVHPRNPEVAWVFPMDGTSVWPRTSPDGKPAAYRTTTGGKAWKRLDKGFPEKQAWWTVKRQAMTADNRNPLGLYLGTTSGEIWGSRDEGESWKCLARHLPQIYALEVAE